MGIVNGFKQLTSFAKKHYLTCLTLLIILLDVASRTTLIALIFLERSKWFFWIYCFYFHWTEFQNDLCSQFLVRFFLRVHISAYSYNVSSRSEWYIMRSENLLPTSPLYVPSQLRLRQWPLQIKQWLFF